MNNSINHEYDPDFEMFYDQFIHNTDTSQFITDGNREIFEVFLRQSSRHFYEIGKLENRSF